MGAYAPLYAWFVGQSINNVPTAFVQIEDILGFELPATARRKPQWWENNSTRHVQARAWLDAGFSTREVDISKETLTFSRNR